MATFVVPRRIGEACEYGPFERGGGEPPRGGGKPPPGGGELNGEGEPRPKVELPMVETPIAGGQAAATTNTI